MANSTSKDVAIYRLTFSTDTENNIDNDEAVGMDYGMKDTSDIGVITYTWHIPSRHTDVPAPADKALTNPDTGLAPLTLTIGIKFNEKNQNNRQIGLLTLWSLQDKEVRGAFSKARFGIRNNKKKWMDFKPTNTAGWKLVDVDFDDVLEYGGMIDAKITLEFAGASSELAAKVQNLLDSGGF